ncbi:BCD family MFS transporter [Rhizobium sp. RU36D]|uniref:BCD family MFS transporter n=1 Tax=Rhizobium sp. RU36D TaxID=1907415 RepID=UPI0009D837C7|nr:BCD family MFS transporter [Rhizobium sp. RU36D]SMC53686.1 MFS transporter, BCD family, chlorophyll transporter [Rhizobium sp. RU36D]
MPRNAAKIPSFRGYRSGLGWLDIVRLGLVQAALGAIVVLTNSTLNRVMIVELGLAAVIPGLLVGIHYGVQITRPVWGHRSDTGGSRTAWILLGLAILALSGTLAAATTFLFAYSQALALTVAFLAYILIGVGIGASGTSLLALIATRTVPERRATAATITWMMMIFGIIVTSIVTGILLDPYSHGQLVRVTAATGLVAFLISWLALAGVEKKPAILPVKEPSQPVASFGQSLREVWADREARLFTLFIFMSMLAYSTQDLILEPFAGLLFGMTPGQSTQLSGVQHAGIFIGMAVVGLGGFALGRRFPALPKFFILAGCLGSAVALGLLSLAAMFAPHWALKPNVFLLGFMNGMFAVAAIGTMMALATRGTTGNAGMRMGVWGAAQAVSFGLGGLIGSVALDLGRQFTGADSSAFAMVFAIEAGLFLVSALLAVSIRSQKSPATTTHCSLSAQPAE